MKAIALNEYGGPEVLRYQEVRDPLVGMDTILVRTRAAGVNPVDWKIREGYLSGAFPHHFPLVPGWDVAGVVETAGPAVTEFKPGDEVLGYVRQDHVQDGAYAELVPAPLRSLVHKPASVSFEVAGALPLAGLTALQALNAVEVTAGDAVLVHAAAGGVGHLAVQIARQLGASRVIGTASERNHDYLRQLGAEPVTYGEGLASRVADLVGGDGKVDAVVDFVGGPALEGSPALLRNPHRHSSIVDPSTVLNQGGRYVFVQPDAAQLSWLAGLVASGDIRVGIQQAFPLEQAAQAHRLLEDGHVRGKLVLTVS